MKPLVLVVEDDDTLRTTLQIALRRAGFEVRVAADGPSGVEAALTDPVPDAIVMDIMLPGCNGVEATLQIHEDERAADVPVIVSTGAVLGNIPLEAARFAAVLLKPYPPSDLIETLQQLIRTPE